MVQKIDHQDDIESAPFGLEGCRVSGSELSLYVPTVPASGALYVALRHIHPQIWTCSDHRVLSGSTADIEYRRRSVQDAPLPENRDSSSIETERRIQHQAQTSPHRRAVQQLPSSCA